MGLETWYVAIFTAAALAALPLVLLAESLGKRLGLVDRPRPGEAQRHVVPRTGGYGLFVAFWLVVGASFLFAPADLERLPADTLRVLGVFLGSLVLLPLAALDDSRRLGPVPQLLGQIVAATIPAFFGLRMEEVASPWGILSIPEPLRVALAVFWIVAMINAINLVDTMDGLAGGVTALACWVLFLRTAWFDQASIAVLPLALGGACVGFLTRNWHPSKVFLGSSGSLLLGYLLGVITVIGGAKIGTAFLVLAVPILDVAWVSYRRLSQGRSPLKGGDAQHLPHQLRQMGMGDRQIVLALYAVCAATGVAILSLHSTLPRAEKTYLAAAVVVGVLGALAGVARINAQRAATHAGSPPPAQPSSSERN